MELTVVHDEKNTSRQEWEEMEPYRDGGFWHSLWILGNDKVLSYSGSFGTSLVQEAKNRQCFFNADEDEDLCKVILDAKGQLNQLDDLLTENSILFKCSRWKVHFSDNFKRSFLKLKSCQTQKLVIALLLKLSSGWRPKKLKIDSLYRSSLHVRQFKVQGDLYIVSTVDVTKCLNYTQVLKIWDLLPVVEIPALLRRLHSVLCMKLEVPMIWSTLGDIVRYKKFRTEVGCFSGMGESDEECHLENSKLRDSLLLMKFYSLSSGIVHRLLCASDGTELELPFEVTDQESDVIVFPESTFILGRSGTGKTTVLTMKMIRLEQHHYFSSEGIIEMESNALICAPSMSSITEDHGVSKDPVLIYGGYSSAENSATSMFDMDDTTEFRGIPDSFSDIQPDCYPLVITFRKFLMMLDGSMENSYFDRFRDVRELSQGKSNFNHFDNGVDVSGSIIGFGAEQVILVRNDSTKKEICSLIGKKALVLTIVESKGLEFQDVLLYKFFETSPLKKNWRLVYGYMKEKSLLDITNLDSFPCFSEGKHKILCSELKQLYVAITRTKQRLWIYENLWEFSNPIFGYWKKLQVVQVRKLDESLAHEMRATSSNTDWSLRGIKLFNEGNTEMAALCFQRSGDSFKEKWAKAAGLRASADRMRGLNFESARVALLEAASIYEDIGKFELSANCLTQSKKYKRAGMLYLEKFEETKLEDAGDCFSLAGCCSTAADIYCRANLFSKCLSVCTKGKLFEMGLNFIETWRGKSNLVANAAKTRE
ncbi:hypothetical protein C5167_018951 [Papaver somniferum]|uniref:UvrD-like helicase C-terminal domain-containing protein n=1 Tax=Papaver somniferum TaxID=3469 RepID=A0A4Y7INR1_PAPSO|nr:hypothetical protein C5167_018951 [Papaver somniferum]